MSDAEQIHRFCSALFGGPDGTGDERLAGLHVSAAWTLPDRRTRWARADDPEAIASSVIEASQQQSQLDPEVPGKSTGVFMGTGLVAKPAGEHRRVKDADVMATVAFFADVDVLGDKHDTKPYPPTFAAARELVESLGLPPTMIVDSGYGLHAWWVLAEPIVYLDEDGEVDSAERDKVAKLMRDWITTLRYRADRVGGWKLDSVFELSRVMRVPGSDNLKDRANPRPVRIVHEDPAARYELDHFADLLAEESILETYTAGHAVESKVAALTGINLHELWARVTSQDYRARDFTPEWLQDILDIDAGGKLSQTWESSRPDLQGDQSSLDASVVRILHDFKISTELQVEAMMCRRLRTGEKIEKVDPRRRTDYVARTIGNIQQLAQKSSGFRDKIEHAAKTTAAGRMNSVAQVQRRASDTDDPIPLPPEPTEDDADPFGEFVGEWIEHVDAEPEDQLPRRQREAAHEQIKAERSTPGHRRERPTLEPAPEPVAEEKADDLGWGSRSQATVTMLTLLDELLIPEDLRERGFQVWRLERRDHGEAQRGRLVVKVPVDYDWPSGDRPDMYRPGRPLYTDWYKRTDFHTPRGFRMAIQHDVLISAQEVGNRVQDWNRLIDALASYWSRDSSGSDLKTAATEWLLKYLLDHAALLDRDEAAQRGAPHLVDHRNWGRDGYPVVWFPVAAYFATVAAEPGGPKGRDAKRLLDYLHIKQRRPRSKAADGSAMKRLTWQEIMPEQFTSSDWATIMEVAYDNELMRASRPRLEAVSSVGKTSRPSFHINQSAEEEQA